MSYHWNAQGDILAWRKDAFFLLDLWKFPPSRVNLGVPYYSRAPGGAEPSWRSLSSGCPDVAPASNVCNGTVFVGKMMQQRIGEMARQRALGGLFPWAGPSYDSYEHNNTLLPWLLRGFAPPS